jgi:ubiquinone/menaquinone biosynthesis C-methylase UbiE
MLEGLKNLWSSEGARLYFLLDADYALRRWRFRKLLGGAKGAAFLDLGGGRGLWSRELLGLAGTVLLVDHEVEGYEGSLDRARRRMARFPGFSTLSSEVTQVPLPDKIFDRILCTEVIEHVPDPQALISEIGRLLKPGARAVITTPSAETLRGFRFFFSRLFRALPWQTAYVRDGFEEHFRKGAGHLVIGYTEAELRGYAAAAGLEVTHVEFLAKDLLIHFKDLGNCLPGPLALLLAPLSWPLQLLELALLRRARHGLGILMVLERKVN